MSTATVFVTLGLTSLPLILGCSKTPLQPTTSQSAPPAAGPSNTAQGPVSVWVGTSTVLSVSATQNTCGVDHTVGQTWTVEWAIQGYPSGASILLFEGGPGQNYMGDPLSPVYYGTLTDGQFVTAAEQDGQRGCFVWHGDLDGRFSPDGRTFDAMETIKYTLFGQDDMVVTRHWTAARQQ